MKSVLPQRLVSTHEVHAGLVRIVEAVRSGEIDKRAAAQAIESEVLDPLEGPRRRDEVKLVCEGQILRAIFLAGADSPQVMDACGALVAAAKYSAELPPSNRRMRALVSTASRLRRISRMQGTLEFEAQITEILLSGWNVLRPRNDTLRKVLNGLPSLVRKIGEQRLDPGLEGLVAEARSFMDVPGAAGIVRDLEREVGRYWLHQDRAPLVLTLPRHPELLTAEEDLELTIDLAESGCLNRAAHDQYIRVLQGEPEARDRLETALQQLSRVGLESRHVEITLRESLNEAIVPWFGHHAWPHLNLAIAAARRGEDERALACFMVALECGGEPGDALPVLVGCLCALGFDQTAEAVLAETEPSLHDVVMREVVTALSEAEEMTHGEFDEARATSLVAFFEEISHPLLSLPGLVVRIHRARAKICRTLGMTREALNSLDRAAGLRPADPLVLVDLAEACLAAGQLSRARSILEASGANRSRRVLLVHARIAEVCEDFDLALACLEAALEEQEVQEDRGARLMESMRLVFELHAGLEGRRRGQGPLPKRMMEEVEQAAENSIHHESRDRTLVLHAADLATRVGNPSREAAALERLRRPEAELVMRLVRAHLAAGAPEAARRCMRSLEDHAAVRPEATLLGGLVALANKRLDEARGLLDRLSSDCPEAILGRAWMAAYEDDVEAAASELDHLDDDLSPGLRAAEQRLRDALELPPRGALGAGVEEDTEDLVFDTSIEPAGAGQRSGALEAIRRRLAEDGRSLELEAELEKLYRAAAREMDHATAHEALLTLTSLREDAVTQRTEKRESLIRARFDAGRHRAVVALTGGAVADEQLPPILACLRVRSLSELGSLERALREFRRLRREAASASGELRREVIRAQRALTIERAYREGCPELVETIEAWRGNRSSEALSAADRAVRKSPRDPVCRYLLALITHQSGSDVRASALAADAVESALHSERQDLVDLARDLLAAPTTGGA